MATTRRRLTPVELPLAAEEFLTWLAVEKGRSLNTLVAYRRDLTQYTTWVGERSLDSISEVDIEHYVAHQRRAVRAPASIARAMVAVRMLHRFLAEEGQAPSDPAARIDLPRVPQGLPRPLGEDEVTSLIDAVVGDEPVARRDRAILELLYGTGMRISELCGLSISDLELDSGLARVLGKGGKERLVPVGRLAHQALDAWLSPSGRRHLEPARWARRDDSDAVFLNQRGGRLSRQGAWTLVRQYGDRIGLGDRLSPHVLRHSCATHMLDHGADVRVVQELLGHASVTTTQVYTKVSGERLRSAFESAHPRAVHR
ncbi:MAG: integrase/recombinase XerD [Acidimicrobiaceae bacterium]|jgi:integrase/recombinase XerD|nr:integrase/recombinase XerD [Acidimicrobiaceae bacterium]